MNDPKYLKSILEKGSIEKDPIDQFMNWYEEVQAQNIDMYNAVVLSTANRAGKVTSRMMLLKEVDNMGFVFYTNYESSKAKTLIDNPYAALNFYWKELERQVRITGTVHKVDESHSDEYFKSRPRESQLGAWASVQSAPVGSRQELEAQYKSMKEKYPDGTDIPRPPHWGGFRLSPDRLEFWQGRSGRMHDRIEYLLDEAGQWKITRLNP